MPKFTSRLCIAVLAVVVVLAAIWISGASAARLCNAEGVGEKCLAKIYPTKTAWEAELATGAKSVLQEGYETIECGKSTLKGLTTDEGGGLATFVHLNIEMATWGACTCGKMEAEASLPWGATITGTGNKDGEIFATFDLKTECLAVKCFYKQTAQLPLKGGGPARIEVSKNLAPLKTSDAKCANPSKWTATYDFKGPTPLYVTKE